MVPVGLRDSYFTHHSKPWSKPTTLIYVNASRAVVSVSSHKNIFLPGNGFYLPTHRLKCMYSLGVDSNGCDIELNWRIKYRSNFGFVCGLTCPFVVQFLSYIWTFFSRLAINQVFFIVCVAILGKLCTENAFMILYCIRIVLIAYENVVLWMSLSRISTYLFDQCYWGVGWKCAYYTGIFHISYTSYYYDTLRVSVLNVCRYLTH